MHAGIVGANGAGKSTLFRMLVGQEQPDSGELKIGETVQTMYVDQSREALQSERSVKHPVPSLTDTLMKMSECMNKSQNKSYK